MRTHPSPPRVRLPRAPWPVALWLGCALIAGCGDGSDPAAAPKSDAARQYEEKVKSLVSQGKSFTEIRAIMRGDTPKKKKGRGKRS